MSRDELTANAAAILAMIIFGASAVATRAVVDDVPPLVLGVLRFGQAGLVIFLALAIVAGGRYLAIRSNDLIRLLLAGVVLYGAFALLFNVGLLLTTASQGALMLATLPVWTALIGRMIGTEHLTKRQITGLGFAVAGIALVFGGQGLTQAGNTEHIAGNLVMLVAAMTGAAGAVLTKRAAVDHPSITVSGYGMLGGAAALLPFASAEIALRGEVPPVTWTTVSLVLFLGVVCAAVGFSLATFGLSRLDASSVAVYINLNPLTAALLGALLLDESIGMAYAAGFVIVILGVLLVNWPARAGRSLAGEVQLETVEVAKVAGQPDLPPPAS